MTGLPAREALGGASELQLHSQGVSQVPRNSILHTQHFSTGFDAKTG